jgi:hypothetical protein
MKAFKIIGLLLLLAGCRQNNFSDDRGALMKLHEQGREAHLSKNANAMVAGFADNFLSVNRGKIDSISSQEENAARFQKYFDAVKFKKWDDLATPTIRFSDDHSLAYMTVNKLVVLETTDSLGKAIEATTHFAWISIFRKQNSGDWKLECVASTNEPETVKLL